MGADRSRKATQPSMPRVDDLEACKRPSRNMRKVMPPPPPAPDADDAPPSPRPPARSGIRAKGSKLPAATVDVVTADTKKDPRRDEE